VRRKRRQRGEKKSRRKRMERRQGRKGDEKRISTLVRRFSFDKNYEKEEKKEGEN
jgi:hypothetical protein